MSIISFNKLTVSVQKIPGKLGFSFYCLWEGGGLTPMMFCNNFITEAECSLELLAPLDK